MNRMRLPSDEEEGVSKKVHGKKERRHSQRLHDKQHRKTFNLPSREKIWDQIPTLTSPVKHWRLKKVVNEFTKVHNIYNNTDAYEDSNESSLDRFFSESSSDSDEVPYHKGFQHIVNHHKRIVDKSSSSDDEEGRTNSQNTSETKKPLDLEDKNVVCDSVLPESFDDENTKDSEDFVCVMRKRKVSAIDSDDSDEDKKPTRDLCTVTMGPSKNDDVQVSESESSNNTSDHDTSCSDNESDTNCSESRSEMLKRKKKNLFDEFKAAQAKRRKSDDKANMLTS